jgi:DNA-binding HxlR family transcriptional regulator
MSNTPEKTSIRRRALVPKEECPMALAAELLGDRWTLLILREAFYGVQRYDDMRSDLGAPRSMLTNRLAKLVDLGLMARRPYQEPGERVRYAYVLTPAGGDLATTFIALTQWGEKHVLRERAPVEALEHATGQSLRAELVNEQGDVVDARNAVLARRQNKP